MDEVEKGKHNNELNQTPHQSSTVRQLSPLRGIPEISTLIAIVKKRAIYKSPLRELIIVLFRVPFFSEDSILAKLGVKRQFDCHCRMRCGIDA